jgi:PKD repeat protein
MIFYDFLGRAKSVKRHALTVFLIFLFISTSAISLFSGVIRVNADISNIVFDFSEVVIPGADTRELAIAFHSISFLDFEGESLGELVFGTPEANTRQGEGWFGNENWSGIGTFQWAGGPLKRASMALEVPDGTEGLLMTVNAARSGIIMNVTIEGVLVSELHVYGNWQLEYVPIDDPVPSCSRDNVPVWNDGHYYPVFPSTNRVYTVDVWTELEDWWGVWEDWDITGAINTMNGLTLVGMQGVINRYGPEVYLDWKNRYQRNSSTFWEGELGKYIETVDIGLEGTDAINFLVQRYRGFFDGIVIYDPSVPDTINLATMIAGLENRIILSPDQMSLPWTQEFTSVTDLTQSVIQNEWDRSEASKYEIYEWAYSALWPRLEHRIIGLVSPGPPSSQMIGPTQGYFPFGIASRDYIVALKLAALYLSPSEEPQAGLFSQILSEAPGPTPVFGFYGNQEYDTVTLASSYGDWVPVITNTNSPLSCGSLTVFSGVRPETIRYEAEIDIDRMFRALGDDPVAMIWCSDGDSLQVSMDVGIHWSEEYWDGVEDLTYSWNINPTVAELAPMIWNYYAGGRSGEARGLISSISGCGYMYPMFMSEDELDEYLEYAARYLEDTGLQTLWVWNLYQPWNDSIATSYYERLKDSGYFGSILGGSMFSHTAELFTSEYGDYGLGFDYRGGPTPTFRTTFFIPTEGYDFYSPSIIEDMFTRKAGEAYIDLDIYSYHQGQLIEDPTARGGQTVLFSHDGGYNYLVGPEASLAPGRYTVTYCMKVPETSDSRDVARLYVGDGYVFPGKEQTFVEKPVSPSDFLQADSYQNFTVEFEIMEMKTDVEFRIQYYGYLSSNSYSNSDLYVDYIMVSREEELELPTFSAILVPGWFENYAFWLAEEIEDAGGVVLHADEFMASLNPEFLLEWAKPILGEPHPLLMEAEYQLRNERYFESLLTIREALRDIPQRTYTLQFEEGGSQYEAAVKANTLIDPLLYDDATQSIVFNTHGPSEGVIDVSVSIPNELYSSHVEVWSNGQPMQYTTTQHSADTKLFFTLDQGPNEVAVSQLFNAPPSALLFYSPTEPTIADTVSFRDLSTDPDGVVVSHRWDFGDSAKSTLADPTHRYSKRGSYEVTLTVTDDDGGTNEKSATIEVVNAPPVCDFTYDPATVSIGEPVFFRDTSTDLEGDPLGHSWSLGEGLTSTTGNPSIRYQTEGVKRVTLTVSDPFGGSDRTTKYIRVVKPMMILVTSVEVPKPSLYPGERAQAHFTFENRGDLPGDHRFEVKLDGVIIDNIEVTLDPGESHTATFEFDVGGRGVHTVEVDGETATYEVKDRIPGFHLGSIAVGVSLVTVLLWLNRRRWGVSKAASLQV